MTALQRGCAVALAHVLIVAGLGGKLLLDRAVHPRVWAKAAPFDPDLPLRGRYVRLRVEGRPEGLGPSSGAEPVSLAVRDGALLVLPSPGGGTLHAEVVETPGGAPVALLTHPLAFFIPEHVPDPSVRADGEELWVELTVPPHGAPRPIRLGVRKADVLTPLPLD
jgi:hypothetical protein